MTTGRPKGLRLRTQCTTEDEFIALYQRDCDDSSIFAETDKELVDGADVAFSFELADGQPMLRGLGVVVNAYPTAQNRFGRAGVHIAFVQLTTASEPIHGRLLEARAAADSHPQRRAPGNTQVHFGVLATPSALPKWPDEESVVGDVRRSISRQIDAVDAPTEPSCGAPVAPIEERASHTVRYEGPLRAPARPAIPMPDGRAQPVPRTADSGPLPLPPVPAPAVQASAALPLPPVPAVQPSTARALSPIPAPAIQPTARPIPPIPAPGSAIPLSVTTRPTEPLIANAASTAVAVEVHSEPQPRTRTTTYRWLAARLSRARARLTPAYRWCAHKAAPLRRRLTPAYRAGARAVAPAYRVTARTVAPAYRVTARAVAPAYRVAGRGVARVGRTLAPAYRWLAARLGAAYRSFIELVGPHASALWRSRARTPLVFALGIVVGVLVSGVLRSAPSTRTLAQTESQAVPVATSAALCPVAEPAAVAAAPAAAESVAAAKPHVATKKKPASAPKRPVTVATKAPTNQTPITKPTTPIATKPVATKPAATKPVATRLAATKPVPTPTKPSVAAKTAPTKPTTTTTATKPTTTTTATKPTTTTTATKPTTTAPAKKPTTAARKSACHSLDCI